jgi:hypothetical protein
MIWLSGLRGVADAGHERIETGKRTPSRGNHPALAMRGAREDPKILHAPV